MLKRLLGLLGWLGVALVFAAFAIRVLKPEWLQWYNTLAFSGLACTLLYILSQWREIARSFSGRQTRYGSLAAGSVVVVLVILAALNYLANRHNKRWDLTAAKQFSLSDQTRKVVQGLQKPVTMRVFDRSDAMERFKDRLEEYKNASKQVQVEYVDVERKPQVANQYQVQVAGTVVIEYDGRTEKVTSDGEQEITNGIIKVVAGKQPKLYFVQGHGEHSPDGSDRPGYSAIAGQLKNDNFLFDKLVLAQVKEVPPDASVLVIAGPKADFLPAEVDMLKAYLGRGGKVLLMIDPPDRADSPQPVSLIALAKEWAIDVGEDVVVDVSGVGQLIGTGPAVPVVARYDQHPITDRFGLMTAYPLARSVSSISAGANGRTAQNLVETSQNSWAEKDLKSVLSDGQVKLDADKGDKAGPVSLAAAVSAPVGGSTPPDPAKKDDAPKPESRMAVFGDSDFISNGFLGIQGNKDLFLNTVNWLAQQENLISIRPRDPQDRRITLTAERERQIFWLAVVVIPGLILVGGIQTWWRRR